MVIHALSRSVAATVGAVVAAAATTSVVVPPAHADDEASSSFREVKLVADTPGHARTTDRRLVNAWGLAESPTSPVWVANNGTSTSTLYEGATSRKRFAKVPLNVRIPGGGAPTGVVFNPTDKFRLSSGGKSGAALFVFAGENGDISAWNKSGDPTKAVLMAHTNHAVYKGLTMVTTGGKHFLLATNFQRNRIDVFNESFHRVNAQHAFPSEGIPDGYGPFGIAGLGRHVYVTYAQKDAAGKDDVSGRGHGFVNVFDQRGQFQDSLVRRGVLDSPWGLAIAPRGFEPFGGKLLVGNFGDGRIHVVAQHSGRVVATLLDRAHHPIVIDGLWALLPGNGTAAKKSDVWFSAGPGDESHGLLGILRHR